MSSWLVLMRRVLAVVAVAACVLLCGVEGQGNVCDLANSDGSASYSLQSLGVLTTGIFQVGLQRTFSKGYIAFCQGKPVACTTKTTAGGWACLTSPDGQIMEILCPNQPVGQFLDSSAPQLGATFTCTSLGGTVTNGFIGSAPHHLSHPPTHCTHAPTTSA